MIFLALFLYIERYEDNNSVPIPLFELSTFF
jgi:hypothetical protein